MLWKPYRCFKMRSRPSRRSSRSIITVGTHAGHFGPRVGAGPQGGSMGSCCFGSTLSRHLIIRVHCYCCLAFG